MWNRKEIKKESKTILNRNYWRIVGISILVAFLLNGLKVDMHLNLAAEYFSSTHFSYNTNAEIVRDFSLGNKGIVTEERILDYASKHYTPEKGVFAQVYNRMTADKSFMYGFLNAVNNMAFKDRFGQGIIILCGVFITLLFTFAVTNVLVVGQSRFVMESISYKDTKMDRLLFPWRANRWKNTAYIMMMKNIYIFLWDFTIIGGIIKRYSYKMVPYIIAENPDITKKEAFDISRKMMYGNKCKAFILDCSLIGWYILNIISFGILRWIFIYPYIDVIYAQLYKTLRQHALDNKEIFSNKFNDSLLFMETSLSDYPVELHPLYDERTKRWIKLDYNRKYTFINYILMFFTFSIIGWMWEVSLHLFGDGVFVNRGFFHGPWLPIYGTGGVLILLLVKRFADRPLIAFFIALLVCGAVEYSVAWFLWEYKQMYWWNYSGYFLNLHGRICAEGLVVFGIGGLGFIYILGPLFDEIYNRISKIKRKTICIILVLIFAGDMVYSIIEPNAGEGITDYQNIDKSAESNINIDETEISDISK